MCRLIQIKRGTDSLFYFHRPNSLLWTGGGRESQFPIQMSQRIDW